MCFPKKETSHYGEWNLLGESLPGRRCPLDPPNLPGVRCPSDPTQERVATPETPCTSGLGDRRARPGGCQLPSLTLWFLFVVSVGRFSAFGCVCVAALCVVQLWLLSSFCVFVAQLWFCVRLWCLLSFVVCFFFLFLNIVCCCFSSVSAAKD